MSCSCTGYDNTGFRIHGVMEEWRKYQYRYSCYAIFNNKEEEVSRYGDGCPWYRILVIIYQVREE